MPEAIPPLPQLSCTAIRTDQRPVSRKRSGVRLHIQTNNMAARVGSGGDHGEILPPAASGGPHGVGDPDDQSLRKVEREIMIPLKMKEKAKMLKCPDEVKSFGECAKSQGLMLPFRCRKEAASLKLCLESAYRDPTFVDLCTREYLEERTEYRRTGIKKKEKKSAS